MAIATVLAALPAILGGDRRQVLVALAIAGVGATLVALLGYVSFTGWAVAALGVEYGILLFGRPAIDFRAPVVGGALLVLAELIQWQHDWRLASGERGERNRRLSDVAMVSLASVAVGSFVLLAGGREPGSIAIAAVGLVASVATLALIWLLAGWPPGGTSIDGSADAEQAVGAPGTAGSTDGPTVVLGRRSR